MGRLICQLRRPAQELGAPFVIAEVDTTRPLDDPGRVTVVAEESGYSLCRPFELPDGRLGWYRARHDPKVPKSTDLHAEAFDLVVDGRIIVRPAPVESRNWLGVETKRRLARWGHVEAMADGRLVHAVQDVTEGRWAFIIRWSTREESPWRCEVFDPAARDAPIGQAVTGAGTAEPSYHPTRGLAWASVDRPVVHLGSRTITTPGLQAYDPVVSPDGSKICVLVRCHQPWEIVERWGLWVAEIATGLGDWIVHPDEGGTTSHAGWWDDRSVVCSRKVESPLWFGAWQVGLDGSRRQLTDARTGSAEQVRRRWVR